MKRLLTPVQSVIRSVSLPAVVLLLFWFFFPSVLARECIRLQGALPHAIIMALFILLKVYTSSGRESVYAV